MSDQWTSGARAIEQRQDVGQIGHVSIERQRVSIGGGLWRASECV